jgi:nucleoside-diphosphate-sugar epimerase
MNVLVLGSEGALGKSLCNFLTNKNINVIKWDIKLDANHDLRNENCIDLILKEVDMVIFLAFDVGGSKYNVNNINFIDNNMKIIINTFHSLNVNKKPFIYTTSCMSNMITNPYGSLKNISEHYVNVLEGINVKLWNVYSYEEISEKSHVIPDFIDSALKNKCIKMKTQGNDVRQFTHCDDFSEAIFIIITNYELFLNWIKSNSLKPIDISCYEWTSILEIALLIKDICKEECNIELDIINGSDLDNHTNKTDPSLSILNDYWKPKISLREGLKDIIYKINT